MRPFVTGMRTLSILPVPGRDTENLASSVPWFPLVGLLLGLVIYGLTVCIQWTVGEWHYFTAFCVVASGVIVTRGLHLDGLADFADAFWGTTDRERTLRIMKDTAVGTFGTLALIVVVLGKWIAVAGILETGDSVWIVTAYVLSRAMMSDLASSLPYARPDGGTASQFVGGATRRHGLVAILMSLIFVFVLQGVHGIYALVAAWAIASAFGVWCSSRIQGVTGDLLGACSEIVEISILVFGAAISR